MSDSPEATRLWCELLPSLDLALTDFHHLFLPLSNAMQGKTFTAEGDMDRRLTFFETRPQGFYTAGARGLLEKLNNSDRTWW